MTPNTPKISQIQQLMRRYVSWYLPGLDIAENLRPTQYPNQYNRQGREQYRLYGLELEGLEMDAYIPQIRVCIETNGSQHYRPITHFHADRIQPLWWQKLLGKKPTIDRSRVQQRFTGQLSRDARKVELLATQNVLLITLDHSDRINDRLHRKMRQAAEWGIVKGQSDQVRRQLQRIDWTRRPPKLWMNEWDALARSGIKSELRKTSKR